MTPKMPRCAAFALPGSALDVGSPPWPGRARLDVEVVSADASWIEAERLRLVATWRLNALTANTAP